MSPQPLSLCRYVSVGVGFALALAVTKARATETKATEPTDSHPAQLVEPPPPSSVSAPSREPRMGLLIGGSCVFGTSWLLALALTFDALRRDLANDSCVDCGKVKWVLWVPVAGPLIADGVDDVDSTLHHAFVTAWSLTQATGLTLGIIGLVGREPRQRQRQPTPGNESAFTSLRLSPLVGAGEVGLSLGGRF